MCLKPDIVLEVDEKITVVDLAVTKGSLNRSAATKLRSSLF